MSITPTQPQKKENNPLQTIAGIAIIVAAVIVCILGIMQINKANEILDKSVSLLQELKDKDKLSTLASLTTVKEAYNQSLTYFSLAIGAIALAGILPRLSSFSITPTGGITTTLQKIEQDLAEIKQTTIVQERLMQTQIIKQARD